MKQTLGQLVRDPDAFFLSIAEGWAAIAVLNAALECGLLDRLDAEPVATADLALELGVPADKLSRLLNFLAAHQLVILDADGRVSQSEATPHLRDAASFIGNAKITNLAASRLSDGLRQGMPPFEVCFGQPVFEYFARHPEDAAQFGQFMAYMTAKVERFVFGQHRFEPFDLAVDVGGSHGGLLVRLLQEHSEASGVLFDLPHVAQTMRDTLRAGPAGDRIDIVSGNFFEQVPEGDLYLLKMILHDWDDDECRAILRSVRRAIRPGGRVAVIEHLLPERPEPGEALIMDLAMMVWDTGRERKLSEYEALFEAAGFRLDRVSQNPHGQSVIEAIPA
jgi:hypothetical protein